MKYKVLGSNSGWNKEGLVISANYIGEYPITGTVIESRVALGGRVKHTVVLNEQIEIFGTVRDRLIVDEDMVTEVLELQ